MIFFLSFQPQGSDKKSVKKSHREPIRYSIIEEVMFCDDVIALWCRAFKYFYDPLRQDFRGHRFLNGLQNKQPVTTDEHR